MTNAEVCDKIFLPLREGLFFVLKQREVYRPAGCAPEGQIIPIMEVPNMRVKVTLSCTECKQRNYNTMKNKKNNPERLEMNKYCRFCKKHTLHKETK